MASKDFQRVVKSVPSLRALMLASDKWAVGQALGVESMSPFFLTSVVKPGEDGGVRTVELLSKPAFVFAVKHVICGGALRLGVQSVRVPAR